MTSAVLKENIGIGVGVDDVDPFDPFEHIGLVDKCFLAVVAAAVAADWSLG